MNLQQSRYLGMTGPKSSEAGVWTTWYWARGRSSKGTNWIHQGPILGSESSWASMYGRRMMVGEGRALERILLVALVAVACWWEYHLVACWWECHLVALLPAGKLNIILWPAGKLNIILLPLRGELNILLLPCCLLVSWISYCCLVACWWEYHLVACWWAQYHLVALLPAGETIVLLPCCLLVSSISSCCRCLLVRILSCCIVAFWWDEYHLVAFWWAQYHIVAVACWWAQYYLVACWISPSWKSVKLAKNESWEKHCWV